MDSRNIYISSQHKLTGLTWSDLIYVGLNHEKADEYRADKVAEYAHALFDEPEVYVIMGRHDSHLTPLDNALRSVSTWLKTTEVLLCNQVFTKAMQFHKIDVMNYDKKPENRDTSAAE